MDNKIVKAIEMFIKEGKTAFTWMTPTPTLSIPKDPLLQRHLLKKIKETTGVTMTLEELEEGLRDHLDFRPTNQDPMATSWVRRHKNK